MSSTKMNNINRRGSMDINNNRRGSMDTKCTSTNKQQLQGRNNSRHPILRGFMTAFSLKTSVIVGALKIVNSNSPQSSSKPRVSMRRRGSLCTQRQSIELLQDSGDRLSQMMMRNDTSAAFDDDCDYDSDLEE